MKFVKWLLIVVLSLVVLFVVIGLLLPSDFSVSRSIRVGVGVEHAFKQVNVIKNWEKWSPWQKMDSTVVLIYEGPKQGKGAKYHWEGELTGAGTLTLVKSEMNSKVETEIEFKDMGMGYGFWTFSQEGDETVVEWRFDSDMGSNIIWKWMALFTEETFGDQLMDGLEDLKASAIEDSEKPAVSLEISEAIEEDIHIFAIADSCELDSEQISMKFGKAYGEIMAYMGKHNIKMAGPVMSISKHMSEPEGMYSFEAVIPIGEDVKLKGEGRVFRSKIPGSKVLRGLHKGSYNHLKTSYTEMFEYIKSNSLEPAGRMYEKYLNDPSKVLEEDIETEINIPVK